MGTLDYESAAEAWYCQEMTMLFIRYSDAAIKLGLEYQKRLDAERSEEGTA